MKKFRSGDLLTRFTTDVDGMMGWSAGVLIVLCREVVPLCIPAMFLISWQLSLFPLFTMSFLVLSTYLLGKRRDLCG